MSIVWTLHQLGWTRQRIHRYTGYSFASIQAMLESSCTNERHAVVLPMMTESQGFHAPTRQSSVSYDKLASAITPQHIASSSIHLAE